MVAVMVWMGAIFAVSSYVQLRRRSRLVTTLPSRRLPTSTEYGILTALLFSALRLHIAHKGHALLTAALVAVLYACSDEWHQSFVPGREGRLRDVGIDSIGAVVASLWLKSKSEVGKWVSGKQ